ncbi:MAG: hypothetical protein FWC24_00375 [Treponema sp.]|nr:hypothetical protein [Treponema sp.]
MKKKIVILIAGMLALVMPIFAQSDDDYVVEQLRDGTLSIVTFRGMFRTRNVNIPSTLYGINVTKIGDRSFSHRFHLYKGFCERKRLWLL